MFGVGILRRETQEGLEGKKNGPADFKKPSSEQKNGRKRGADGAG